MIQRTFHFCLMRVNTISLMKAMPMVRVFNLKILLTRMEVLRRPKTRRLIQMKETSSSKVSKTFRSQTRPKKKFNYESILINSSNKCKLTNWIYKRNRSNRSKQKQHKIISIFTKLQEIRKVSRNRSRLWILWTTRTQLPLKMWRKQTKVCLAIILKVMSVQLYPYFLTNLLIRFSIKTNSLLCKNSRL